MRGGKRGCLVLGNVLSVESNEKGRWINWWPNWVFFELSADSARDQKLIFLMIRTIVCFYLNLFAVLDATKK